MTTPQPEVILLTTPQPEVILLKIYKLSIIKQFTSKYHLLFLVKHIHCRSCRNPARLNKWIHMEGRRYPPCGDTGLKSCACVQLVLLGWDKGWPITLQLKRQTSHRLITKAHASSTNKDITVTHI